MKMRQEMWTVSHTKLLEKAEIQQLNNIYF